MFISWFPWDRTQDTAYFCSLSLLQGLEKHKSKCWAGLQSHLGSPGEGFASKLVGLFTTFSFLQNMGRKHQFLASCWLESTLSILPCVPFYSQYTTWQLEAQQPAMKIKFSRHMVDTHMQNMTLTYYVRFSHILLYAFG